MLTQYRNIHILLSAQEKKYKTSDKSEASLIPSICVAKCSGSSSSMPDLGLNLSRGRASYAFWGIKRPRNLVQAYRALMLLSECPVIREDTLCACYYAAGRIHDSTVDHYLSSLKDTGFASVDICRTKLLEEEIPEDIFINFLLSPMQLLGLPFNENEIKNEVLLGALAEKTLLVAHHVAS